MSSHGLCGALHKLTGPEAKYFENPLILVSELKLHDI